MSGWGRGNGPKLTYVATNSKNKNKAGDYSRKIMRSEIDRYERGLDSSFVKIINNNSTYLQEFFCDKKDLTIFNKLKSDMDNAKTGEMVTWNKHFKHEDPTFSETFKDIIKKMSDHFNVEVLATRLNYYKDGNDYKTFHKDSHAYSNGQKEDFTMGASFGASRELEFKYDGSETKFSFPQHNGDIFAFTSVVNDKFMHGVPKSSGNVGPRFSIIAWGKRRSS